MWKIAKIVVPISLEKEFDYIVPFKLKIKKGMRVLVDFKGKKRIGLVVGFSQISKIRNLKPILDTLDLTPTLNSEHITLAKHLSNVYPYAQGEFLFMMLPPYLKRIRKTQFPKLKDRSFMRRDKKTEVRKKIFIEADNFLKRYSIWKKEVEEKLEKGSVLICFPQLSYLMKAKEILERDFGRQVCILHSQEKDKELFLNWEKSRKRSLILGTRVSIFYYPYDLELIVVEEENSPYYFQEEKPFHHLLDVTWILSEIKKIDLILSGNLPSLGTYNYIRDKKIELIETNSKRSIKVVKVAEFSKKKVISPLLVEILRKAIEENKKVVILWNKRRFSRFISCSNCGHIFQCTRCSGYLQLSLKENEAFCPYCQRKITLPKICNHCNNGYVKSRGYGIERIGEIIKRIFPEAKVDSWENHDSNSQIIISTSKILSYLYEPETFDLGLVLDIDSYLLRLDYDATFKAFLYLKKLLPLFKSLYVFTRNNEYYLFQYLNKEWRDFYEKELDLRRKLNLPPFGLVAKITLRAANENILLKRAKDLYNRLEELFKEVYGPFKEQPFKLRDKFRYSLIIKTKRSQVSRKKIKETIKTFRTSSVQLAVSLW